MHPNACSSAGAVDKEDASKVTRRVRRLVVGWVKHSDSQAREKTPLEDWQTHGTTSMPTSWLCIVSSSSTKDKAGVSQDVPIARPNHATAAVRLVHASTRGATPLRLSDRRHHQCHDGRTCFLRAVTFVVLFRRFGLSETSVASNDVRDRKRELLPVKSSLPIGKRTGSVQSSHPLNRNVPLDEMGPLADED